MTTKTYVSRAAEKLLAAFDSFDISVKEKTCADFGCSTGGFTQVLLQKGAKKVFSVDTAKGELHWILRTDPRVVVIEKTNALFINLPEQVDLITIDTAWTKQSKILPNALNNLKKQGDIISLVKPQYEVDKKLLKRGKVDESELPQFLENFKIEIQEIIGKSIFLVDIIKSPIKGDKAGNIEYLAHFRKY